MSGKNLLFFVGGLGLGAAVGGYFVGINCSKRYKSRIEELENTNDQLAEKLEKTAERALSEPLRASEKDISNIRSMDEDNKPDYAKLSREYRNDDFDIHFSDRVGPSEDDGDDEDDDLDEGDFKFITQEEFARNVDWQDNETLTYYLEDNVLADANDMPIHDEEKVIGMECLEKLENATEDDDYYYVENEAENKLYEIIVEHNQNFYRDVLGMD